MTQHLALSIVALACIAQFSAAQEAPQSKLKPANATLRLLSRGAAQSVRELSDGRVLFDGPRLTTVADMKTGRLDSIPDLPGSDVVALAADSTLVRVSGGWIFVKDTKVLGMLEATNAVVAIARNFVGADSLGYVVALRQLGTDSNEVVRVNRNTAEVESLARIKRFPGVRGGVPAPVYSISERVVYTLDGWLGILRTAPYRVDWRSPAGQWTLGKALPIAAMKLDTRERVAYMAQQARASLSAAESPDIIKDWPQVIEPSTGMTMPLATSDVKLLVFRTPTADYPDARYDVVNREGVVERQIVMGVNETIVGFGVKSVYVRVSTGPFSSVQLERHPWP